MNDTERKASKAMIRYVLMIFVIAIIISVAYLALFTPGKAETVSPLIGGGPMRYYIYEVHTDQSRNRLLTVFKDEAEAGVMELELQSNGLETENFFIKMFPAQNVEEARIKADEMRPIPLMLMPTALSNWRRPAA